ncbi:secondary metabolism regulator LAE1 [Colletotrichum liriopes]|uniref:Secondary metabolism regulator LAE1 n=1 Tax=Colletotrichum liriopes TaxID=708192 RepID=A0AA37GMY9_9PEZI|nr:secondary metabolism regulator LAE1 [Colletotrichum liriopes]
MADIDHEVLIAADHEESDDSQSEVSNTASSTTSLSSSILQHRIENGRTYHRYKDGTPPCNEDAKVGRVLDVGSGSGSWAIDFGDLHPEAEPFEYIHSRFMTASIRNWEEYIKKCYDNLTPGGYLELQDADVMPRSDDDLLPKDAAIIEYVNLLKEVSKKLGREYVEVSSLKNMMIEAGFLDVEMRMYKWPHNEWPKDPRYKKLGFWTQENFGSALEAICMAPFTRVLGWTRDEVNVFLVQVRKDLKNKSYHAYSPVYCIVGRKPEKVATPAPAAAQSE